jgi:outer membrane protein OmpA-like peptidoglycan-associated protein/tetratricopeptide (TPR) repeat protein
MYIMIYRFETYHTPTTFFKLKFHYILLFLVLSIHTFSITKLSACSKANEAYDRLLFSIAIQEYEKCLKNNNKDLISLEKLATAYKILGNYKMSLLTFNRIENKEVMSIASKLEYAYLLNTLESKEKALEWVKNCLTQHDGHPQLLNMKDVFSKESKYEDNSQYKVDEAPFNSTFSDYCPAVFDGKIIFSSTRLIDKTKIDGYTSENFSRLYYYDTERQKVLPFALELNGQYNIGSVAFINKGKEMYFTKNRNTVNNKNVATFVIWVSKFKGGKWEEPVPAFLQKDNFNYVHPTLNPDGTKLIFAGDLEMNNSYDLYYCERKTLDEPWSAPKRLPDFINSVKDEVFPSFLSDSVLVFSQESPEGLGGLDMFTTRYVKSDWTLPVNLGKPFNSNFDDYGMMSDDNFLQGYFSSTRDNNTGDDNIYSFVKIPKQFFDITIEIKDSISGQPIKNVGIVLIQENLQNIVYKTDSLGKVFITGDKNNEAGIIIAYKGTLLKTLKLSEIQPDKNDEAKISVQYTSDEFIISGITKNQKGDVVPDVELAFTEKETNKSKKVTSDNSGEFEVSAKPNTSYEITTIKEGYFTPVSDINTSNFSRKDGLNINTSVKVEKAEPNKIFQLKNIYYDFDKWTLRKESISELNNLITFLQNNPLVKISIDSHTDARGVDEYNLWLSQKRSESVISYLADKNIDLSRIKARGLGEKLLVNECNNNTECIEEKHQENRRTELVILSVE